MKSLWYPFKRKKKNPFAKIWYAIRTNRATTEKSIHWINLRLEALEVSVEKMLQKPKRGRPKKSNN